MTTDHHEGAVHLPTCPDCDSPLVWPLEKDGIMPCFDYRHRHTWWCPTCEDPVTVGMLR